MDSTCRIFYETERGAIVNGIEEPVYTDRATNVPCRVSAQIQGAANETTPADALGTRMLREVSIPVDSPAVMVGDFLQLTTVGPFTDAALADVRFRVIDAGMASQATARRMKVEVDL